jgi:hypothetical protein
MPPNLHVVGGFVRTHLRTAPVARVVYGAIIGLALVVALERYPPGSGAVIASLIATAIAVGLAEIYSDSLGEEVRLRRRLTRPELRRLSDGALAVAFGIGFPALFFVLAAFGLMSDATAFDVAEWSGVGLIAFYGAAAAHLAGAAWTEVGVRAVLAALIAVALIAMKALIH